MRMTVAIASHETNSWGSLRDARSPARNRSRTCIVKIDQFQRISDLLGQGTGERVLDRVKERLSEVVPTERVFYLGGGQFLVVLAERGGNTTTPILGLAHKIERQCFLGQGSEEFRIALKVIVSPPGD